MRSGGAVQLFVGGLVTIGIITAIVLPGRNSASVAQAVGKAGSGLLGTAISGKNSS